MDSSDTEYHKLNKWLDTIHKLPFGNYTDNKINNTSSLTDKCKYLLNIKDSLDKYVFGHNDAKINILQYMSKCISLNIHRTRAVVDSSSRLIVFVHYRK